MKKTLLILFILCSSILQAQNLVPNPSFEDTIGCPDNANQVYKATGWSSFGNSSDYFNSCCDCGNLSASVPSNAQGYQLAVNNGNAYCGFYSRWGSFPFDTLYREFIGSQLLLPMIPETKYYVSIKISRAEGIKCATNKIGVLFSTVAFTENNPAPVNNFSHVFTNNIITDTSNWETISGSFTADSAYNYIIIGNFFQNYLTDTISNNGYPCTAYYYVDDIYVSTDSIVKITDNSITESIEIYPNPSSSNVIVRIKTKLNNKNIELYIYNLLGNEVAQFNIINNETVLETSNIPSGIYLLKFRNENKIINKKIIIN